MRRLLPFIFIIFCVSFLFLPYFFPPPQKMLFGGDIYDAYYYWKGYLSESILSGTIPFWNPYNFSGTPFLAHPNINILYPLNWIFILFPLNQSFTFYMFIHMCIAGVTMYWLGRQYTDRYGALFCAIAYSLGSYFSARVYAGHPEYIDTAAWIPLAFGLARRAILVHSKKSFLLAVLGVGLLFLSGNELFILYVLELLGLYIFYLFFSSSKWNITVLLKNFGYLFLIVFLSLCITAIEVLPRLEFLRSSLRSEGISYAIAGSGSLSFEGLKLFLNPLLFGLPQQYTGPWPNLSEYLYYIGILPILLLVGFFIVIIFQKKVKAFRLFHVSKDIWFFLIIAIPFFLLISLGMYSPWNFHEILWKYVPFYHSYRFPARHMFVVFFSLSLVSGMILGGIKNKFIKRICIIFLSINLLIINRHFFQFTDVPTKTFDKNLIYALQDHSSLYRILPDFTVVSSVRRDLDFGASAINNFQSTSDYNSMILSKYYRFIDLLNQTRVPSTEQYNVEIPPIQPSSPYVDFLNVRYLISDKGADVAGNFPALYKFIREGERYRLYENLSYMKRFFLVYTANVYQSSNELEDAILGRTVDLSNTVLFLNEDIGTISDFDLDCSMDKGQVSVLSYNSHLIQLMTESPCDSFLSTSEVYYPGWKATIDGNDVPVYKSNYAFRSLYVPKGKHMIVFYYFPAIYIVGLVISLLTGLTLFLIWRYYPGTNK